MVTSSDVPPKDRNGRVSPVTGSMPVTPPMLMMACTAIQAVMPPASSWLKRSAARSDVLTPRYRMARNSPITPITPMRPSSSASTAKMKSVWDSGR